LIYVNDLHPDVSQGGAVGQGRRVMADFIIEVLSREQIHAVYPLVREAVPMLDLSTWLRFARQLTGARRKEQCGIIAARREGRTFPSGLFCYRVADDLNLGKVLIADHFVAVDLLDPAAVLAALVEELDGLAKRLGCQAVRSLVHGGAPDVEDGLYAAGHRPEPASLLLKNLLETSRGHHAGARGTPRGRSAMA
jgi:hypothetical protein